MVRVKGIEIFITGQSETRVEQTVHPRSENGDIPHFQSLSMVVLVFSEHILIDLLGIPLWQLVQGQPALEHREERTMVAFGAPVPLVRNPRPLTFQILDGLPAIGE